MLRQIYPDAGLGKLCQRLANGATGNRWRLYTNDFSPGPDSIAGDFDFVAWSDNTVVLSDFSTPIVAGDVALMFADDLIDTNSGGTTVDVYGYAILDDTGLILLGAARFTDAPRSVPDGNTVSYTPFLATKSQYTSP